MNGQLHRCSGLIENLLKLGFMLARDQTLAIQFVASYLTDAYPYDFLSK
jgi:hypothetical protein